MIVWIFGSPWRHVPDSSTLRDHAIRRSSCFLQNAFSGCAEILSWLGLLTYLTGGTEIWMWWCLESWAVLHYCPYSMALALVWLVSHHLWLDTVVGLCSDKNASPKTARWSNSSSRLLQQHYDRPATILQMCLLLREDALQLDELLLFHSVNESLLPAPSTRGELWWTTPSVHLLFQPATIFIASDIDVIQVALIKPKWQLGPPWWPLATCM